MTSPSNPGATDPMPTSVTGSKADRYPRINPSCPPTKDDPSAQTVAITYSEYK